MNGLETLKNVGKSLIYIAAIYGLSIALKFISDYLLISKEVLEPSLLYGYLSNQVIYIVLITISLVYLKGQNKTVFTERSKISLNKVLVIFLIALLYRVFEDPFLRNEVIYGTQKIPDASGGSLDPLQIVMVSLNFVLLSSVLEELVFRRIALGYFFLNNIALGVFVTSTFFTVKHISLSGSLNVDYIQLLGVFIFSLVSSFCYLYHGGLLYAILFHFFYNLIWLFIGVYKNVYWKVLTALDFRAAYWVFVFASGLLLCILLITRSSKITSIKKEGNVSE